MVGYNFEECTLKQYESAVSSVGATASKEPVSFLQAPFYGEIQTKSGKDVVYFLIKKDEKLIGSGLAITYTAPGGLRFLYAPYGPISSTWDEELLNELRIFLKPIAKRLGCTFVRLDTDDLTAETSAKPISAKVARTASLQPRAEWVLDISQGKDALWMGFHKHARYNIRLAERAETVITHYAPQEAPLDDFFALMQTTAERDNFGIFDRGYYEAYLSSLSDTDGFVTIATIDGKPAAAALFVTYDKQTHYVFAGSSNEFRKIAPAYAVLWAAIQEAKHYEATLFNFGGIIDDVKSQELGGVTSFKKRFGGYRVTHKNPYDIVYKSFAYTAFRLYKSIR